MATTWSKRPIPAVSCARASLRFGNVTPLSDPESNFPGARRPKRMPKPQRGRLKAPGPRAWPHREPPSLPANRLDENGCARGVPSPPMRARPTPHTIDCDTARRACLCTAPALLIGPRSALEPPPIGPRSTPHRHRIGPASTGRGQPLALSDPCRIQTTRFLASLANLRPNPGEFGRTRPGFGQSRPGSGQVFASSVDAGPNPGNTLAKLG